MQSGFSSKMAEDSQLGKTLGMSSGGVALLIIGVFYGVTRFFMTDLEVLWNWWWIAGAVACALVIFATASFLKGKISGIVNGLLFISSMVLLFMSYWYSSNRVIVFADKDTLPADAAKKLFEKYSTTVFFFVGKRTGKNLTDSPDKKPTFQSSGLKDAVDKVLKTVKEDSEKSKSKGMPEIEVGLGASYPIDSKQNAEELKKAFSNVRFTSYFKLGKVYSVPDIADGFSEGDGIKEDDFKKNYLDKANKTK